jgi:hypothetical protein
MSQRSIPLGYFLRLLVQGHVVFFGVFFIPEEVGAGDEGSGNNIYRNATET